MLYQLAGPSEGVYTPLVPDGHVTYGHMVIWRGLLDTLLVLDGYMADQAYQAIQPPDAKIDHMANP